MCSGSGARRKQFEKENIFKLGSMAPQGLNNVSFHLNWARALRLPRALGHFKFNDVCAFFPIWLSCRPKAATNSNKPSSTGNCNNYVQGPNQHISYLYSKPVYHKHQALCLEKLRFYYTQV